MAQKGANAINVAVTLFPRLCDFALATEASEETEAAESIFRLLSRTFEHRYEVTKIKSWIKLVAE